jgi:hypothetical protein
MRGAMAVFFVLLPIVGGRADAGGITDLAAFLDRCPVSDPLYGKIRSDFQLFREGRLIGTVTCSEPVSSMTADQITEELRALQSLRAAYYMDLGQTHHLPWTSGPLYAWLTSKVKGINIASSGYSWCCTTVSGLTVFTMGPTASADRLWSVTWEGIESEIGLFAHEVRHLDVPGHVSCCGIPEGCDQSYDPSNISPYGVQWFLESAYLSGAINVGWGCLPSSQRQILANWTIGSANYGYRDRFCTNPPPLLTMPAQPGGPCPGSCIPDAGSLCLLGNRFRVTAEYTAYDGHHGPGKAASLTADTGTFWFFDSANVEAVVKMVSFCGSGSNNVAIYAGGLTDLGVTLTVTDGLTGLTKTYSNTLGNPFQLIRDGPFVCP